MFEPSRQAGLTALTRFVPHAGRFYTDNRNFDYGPARRDNISMLSPYIRHRIVSEHEAVAAVLAVHSLAAAEKYIQEIFWRTYWKGWLQHRPAVWHQYLAELDDQKSRKIYGLASAYDGETGIECFDHWVNELRTNGYLHNHARMWFASIWIFTLRLPWQLGADFFLTHLFDGDPASNTLSWRWVAGLQTIGKHYVASAENIHRYTDGRFVTPVLASHAEPVSGTRHPDPVAITMLPSLPRGRYMVLLTEEDMCPFDALPAGIEIAGVATAGLVQPCAPNVAAFRQAALENAAKEISRRYSVAATPIEDWSAHKLATWAKDCGVTNIVTAETPAGFAVPKIKQLSQELAGYGVCLHMLRRDWDDLCWPHTRKGFFAFKEKIPAIIGSLNLS
jgi:deoxyribodipyrimidine photo-lyase